MVFYQGNRNLTKRSYKQESLATKRNRVVAYALPSFLVIYRTGASLQSSSLTPSWSRHLRSLLLLHLISCLPYNTAHFPKFAKKFLFCIFLLQFLPLHPMQVSFQATSPLEIFTFTRKTSFSPCLYSTLVTHATVLSRHSEAGLVFPLKQISNSSGSCCHLEICYVPGTVLNTHPQ